LIAIQNAIGLPCIAGFKLSADGLRVTRTTVLENRSKYMNGEPTTGAIKGDDLYFIINSQADNMDGDHVADAGKLAPVRTAVATPQIRRARLHMISHMSRQPRIPPWMMHPRLPAVRRAFIKI
jgi:hypothetical protein